MDIFDILGPVMVGPSSSHTAGAARIGKMARTLLGGEPMEARIHLHGSFAETGSGHGTDRALVAGLLGMNPDDMRIPFAFQEAEKAGLHFTVDKIDLRDAHPNTGHQAAGAAGRLHRRRPHRGEQAGRHRRQLHRRLQHAGGPQPR